MGWVRVGLAHAGMTWEVAGMRWVWVGRVGGLGQSLGVAEDGSCGVDADVWVVAFLEAFVEEFGGVE